MSREEHVRRGVWLEYITLAWNALEAVVAIGSGAVSGSIALVGFGLDSVIEMSSGAALLWRLRLDHHDSRREMVEERALKAVGWCFLALAAYVAFDSGKSLLMRQHPDESIPGIAIAAASLLVMPLLARAKRRVAAGLGSAAMRADSRQTDICAYLSAVLLGGLILNAALGWWWADAAAALVMVPMIAIEGANALRGKGCGCHASCEDATTSAGVRTQAVAVDAEDCDRCRE